MFDDMKDMTAAEWVEAIIFTLFVLVSVPTVFAIAELAID
jgi:hypothetical protein